MSRHAMSKDERPRLATEAKRTVDEELAAMPVPSRTAAVARAAKRLGVTTRTVRSRLADAPTQPTYEELYKEDRAVQERIRKVAAEWLAAAQQQMRQIRSLPRRERW